jgi:hypothetical protein
MARYRNGSIRPSLPESVSDRLRGVRSGYLVAGGVPVTGNYVDAIRDGLRGGFGPPPTPTVGYAATAEYVYPSQKMVTGAALAGQMLRESLAQPSYSSPAAEYHRGLRGLRGLGASSTFTVRSGMNATQAVQALNAACGGPYGLADLLAATGARSATTVPAGTFACPGTSGADTGGGATVPAPRGLPAGVNAAIDANLSAGEIDREEAAAQKQTLLSEEAETLAAYSKATAQQKAAYEACIRDESNDLLTDFSACRDRVGGTVGPSAWDAFVDGLKAIGGGAAEVTAEASKFAIDAGIQKLQSAGIGIPAVCATNKYSAGCAGAVAAALSALDKSQQTLPPSYTPPRGESDNTGLFIGLGVAAVAVIGILAFALSKKPASAA